MEFIHFLSMATFKTQVMTDNTDARGLVERILSQNIRTLITFPAVTNSPTLFLIYTV